ncbi:MAG: terminase family protein [Patescibacteria group bacterium]
MSDKNERPPIDIIKKEWQACANDPIYFLLKYGYIRTEEKGIIKFDLFDYQKEIVNYLRNDSLKHIAVVKSRQLGLSTIVAGFVAWVVIFRKDRHIFNMATKLEIAQVILDMVRTFIEECPKWLNFWTIKKNNTRTIELSNGSWVRAMPTSRDVGRAQAASLFVIDEAGLIDKLDELWAAIAPSVATGGRVIALSTPRGAANKFADIIQGGSRLDENGELIQGSNEFLVFEYPWWRRYDQAWFDKMKIGKSPKEIAQEFECKFVESGDTFIDPSILQKAQLTFSDPIEKRYEDKMWIWKHPQPGKQFILCSDVSRGDSSDHSTFHIIDVEDLDVVAEYKHKIKPDQFARILCDVGRSYNNALVVPERNAYGSAVIQEMLKMEYDNMYFVYNGVFISKWDLPGFPKAQAGHATSSTTRPIMMQKLEEYLRLSKIKIHSRRLYSEFTTFSWKGDKPCAPRNKSDDLILALAIGIYVYEQIYGNGFKLANNTATAEPFGFMRSGEKFSEVMAPSNAINMQNELESFMNVMMIRRK